MRRIIIAFLMSILLSIIIVPAVAAEETTTTIEDNEISTTVSNTTETSTTSADINIPSAPVPAETDDNYLDNQLVDVKENEAYVCFSLDGAKKNITMVVVCNEKEFELEFTKDNNYIVQGIYPTGDYTIKSVTSSVDKHARIKILSLDNNEDNTKSFTIKHSDFKSFDIVLSEKSELFIITFLRKEWIFLIILAGLTIGYYKLRNSRILPSQEK